MENTVIVIAGPTATGKTKLGIELAKRINGEIVSCDSMQIYKDMNIGTAKVTKEEAQGIKHYLVDYIYPTQRYSVIDFKKDSLNAIKEILCKGKKPILVGGTGLYINSLIYDINFSDMDLDINLRNDLLKKAETEEGLNEIYNKAKEIDPEATEKISPNDKKRICRIIEIYNATGMKKSELEDLSHGNCEDYNYKKFALNMDRSKLYKRIDLRVDKMIQDGLIDEVKNLLKEYDNFPTAMQAVGYKEVKEYLDGSISYDEMISKIKINTRHLAKRQLTWFKKNNDYTWLDAEKDVSENVKIIMDSLGKNNEN